MKTCDKKALEEANRVFNRIPEKLEFSTLIITLGLLLVIAIAWSR